MNKASGSKNCYTLDTCVVIKVCENPNLGRMMSCRIDFENADIYLNSQTIDEAQSKGFEKNYVLETIMSSLGSNVICDGITDEMYCDAQYMQSKYPSLHPGDSEILAYALTKNSTLVSCDKGLLEAAKMSGAEFVNPDILPCDELFPRPRTRWYKVVKDAIKTVNDSPQKIKTPIRKITWEAFA